MTPFGSTPLSGLTIWPTNAVFIGSAVRRSPRFLRPRPRLLRQEDQSCPGNYRRRRKWDVPMGCRWRRKHHWKEGPSRGEQARTVAGLSPQGKWERLRRLQWLVEERESLPTGRVNRACTRDVDIYTVNVVGDATLDFFKG